MLTFTPVSAPYEARQPLVQPEGPSSGNQGTKPPRHQASLIRVRDVVGLCQWETLGTWFFDGPSFFFSKEDIKLSPHAKIVLLVLLLVYFPKSFFAICVLTVSRLIQAGSWSLVCLKCPSTIIYLIIRYLLQESFTFPRTACCISALFILYYHSSSA